MITDPSLNGHRNLKLIYKSARSLLTSGVGGLTITNLKGTKSEYLIDANISVPTTGAANTWVGLILNNDTTSGRYSYAVVMDGVITTAQNPTTTKDPAGTSTFGLLKTESNVSGDVQLQCLLRPSQGGYPSIRCDGYYMNNSTLHTRTRTSGFYNQTTELTRLNFYLNNSQLMTGTVKVYQVVE